MLSHCRNAFSKICSAFETVFSGPQALALMPAVVLAAFWIGGELTLILTAIGFPLCVAVLNSVSARKERANSEADDLDGPTKLEQHLQDVARQAKRRSLRCGCICIELDDFDSIVDRYGQAAAGHVVTHSQDRLRSALRAPDKVYHVQDGEFAIALSPVKNLDVNIGLNLTERLQKALEQPITLDSTTVYISASCGLAINSQLKSSNGRNLLNAAETALRDARRHAPSAIRAYAPGMNIPKTNRHTMSNEVFAALENGQIRPWFQPQISTDTGKLTGFEALARWVHPKRGLIAPADFLPIIEDTGKMELLGEVILHRSLEAVKAWDNAGLVVPCVGVNFSPDELRNPRLVEKIEWTLDRFDLTPERLTIEILETVVATSPDDVVARNINGLAELGCAIDLDDFGTGHASISSLRRFAIKRLKIDRSFVMKVDQDPEQQRMMSAILLMAEQLGLETLAEGVETAGELTMLAQLGCRHVQGFGICRPLPYDKTIQWVADHMRKLGSPPKIGRKTG